MYRVIKKKNSDSDSDYFRKSVFLYTTCKKAIFLTPKVYCLETLDGEFIYKVKGLKHEIELTLNDFEQLLYKDSIIKKSQGKWFRNLSKAKIEIIEELYSIKINENKRKLVYDKNNKLISTTAYKINKDKIIIE